jgi:hypothetical protein
MGASGSAWIKPKKRQGLRSEQMRNIPHPVAVRPGQRYFPLSTRQRTRVTLRVTRVAGDTCEARREDTDGRTVRIPVERLLATDAHGAARFYRFIGFAPGRRYQTHAWVVAIGAPWAQLICPEWHPRLPISIALQALPPRLQVPGAWVSCKADFSADAPARVMPTGFAPPRRGFAPQDLPPVDIAPTT